MVAHNGACLALVLPRRAIHAMSATSGALVLASGTISTRCIRFVGLEAPSLARAACTIRVGCWLQELVFAHTTIADGRAHSIRGLRWHTALPFVRKAVLVLRALAIMVGAGQARLELRSLALDVVFAETVVRCISGTDLPLRGQAGRVFGAHTILFQCAGCRFVLGVRARRVRPAHAIRGGCRRLNFIFIAQANPHQ